MNPQGATIFEVVRLIDLQPVGETAFCVLIVSADDHALDSGFVEELQIQTGRDLHAIDAAELAPVDLIKRIQESNAAVIVVSGLKGWSDAKFVSLDINRSGLEAGKFLIFAMDGTTAARFLARAPNLRSSIGTHLFVLAPDVSLMTEAEVADRLAQLREHYKMSDAEVIGQAQSGTLQADPHFVEWLVLMGRGELAK